jgi:hypothetical protein
MKLLLLAAFIISFSTNTALSPAPPKVDFSGTWSLDKAASQNLPPQILDQTLIIKQTGDRIDVQAKITTEQGEETAPDTIIVDGKQNDYVPRGPGGLKGTGKRTAKWTEDGKGVQSEEDATFDTPNGAITFHATRTILLSPDGKTLTMLQTIKSDQDEQNIKRVYVKK